MALVAVQLRSRVVHVFVNDALAVDRHARTFRPRRFAQVAMEIRRVSLSESVAGDAFGVFVASGAHFELGDLVGCYSGAVVHGSTTIGLKPVR